MNEQVKVKSVLETSGPPSRGLLYQFLSALATRGITIPPWMGHQPIVRLFLHIDAARSRTQTSRLGVQRSKH